MFFQSFKIALRLTCVLISRSKRPVQSQRLPRTAQEARLSARIRNKFPGKRNKGEVKRKCNPQARRGNAQRRDLFSRNEKNDANEKNKLSALYGVRNGGGVYTSWPVMRF